MIIFISGSINAGKTTTGKALAEKLGIRFVDIDDFQVPNVELAQKYSAKIALAVEKANEFIARGESAVFCYVIRPEDYEQIMAGLNDPNPFFVTLAPPLEVARSIRGNRILSEWELFRIKYLYDSGIANPAFGEIINNSQLTVDEVVAEIEKITKKAGALQLA